MASLRKRTYKSGTTVWVIEYSNGRKNLRKTLGPIDKRTAQQIFHQFCGKLAKQKLGFNEIQKIALKDFQAKMLAAIKAEKAARTFERDSQVMANFVSYFGNVFLDSLVINELEEYRLHRLKSVSPATVNLEFRHLKAIFNRAIRKNYIMVNLFERIKPLREPESDLPRFLELDEIEIVREAFKGDDFESLVEFYLLTGARLREPLSLTWDDVDLKRKYIVIRSEYTKGRKHRIVSFEDDEALETLICRLPTRDDNRLFGPKDNRPQWKKRWISRKTSRTLTRCGFPWASCHTFRHTYISHLVMAGVPLFTVQQLVGHSDYKTTLRYAHLAPGHKSEMSRKRPY